MSRPFSYNDENFTVIGNILFVHFPFSSAASIGTRLIEIPSAICNRLLTFSNVAAVSYGYKESNSGIVILSCSEYNGGCYLINKANMSASPNRFFYTWYVLKDI